MQIPNIVLVAAAAARNIGHAINVGLRTLALLKDWARVAYANACRVYLRFFAVRRPGV